MPGNYRLLIRNGTYYYNRRVPKNRRHLFGSREVIKQSLGTKSLAEAKVLRSSLDVEWDARFRGATSSKPHTKALTRAEVERLVRSHVESDISESKERLITTPPSKEVRWDMEMEALQVLSWLQHPDRPDAQEYLSHASALFEGRDRGEIQDFAIGLLHLGLIERQKRWLAALGGAPEQPYFDSLFDPDRSIDLPFSELAAQYLGKRNFEDAAADVSQKTRDKIASIVATLVEVVGAARPAKKIDYNFCLTVREKVSKLPTNLRKHFKGLSADQAIAACMSAGGSTLSLHTQANYLQIFRAILSHAVDTGAMSSNPALNLKPLGKEKLTADQKRGSFSEVQLTSFFRSGFYADAADGKLDAYKQTTRGWRFWMPLIALLSGMRAREIAQLLVCDIKQTAAGTWYIHVTDQGEGEERKRLKNISSRRRVPIHDELLKIGFLEFVEARKSKGPTSRLFRDLPENKYGDPAAYALRRFNEAFLDNGMVRHERQTFHSFRHCFRDAIRRISAPQEFLRVAGWTVSKGVSDSYGSQQDDPDLNRPWMEKISYPGLDLSALYGKGALL